MRILIPAFLFLAAALAAQPTHREVTNATTAEQDGKQNSDSVPEVYSIDSQFERITVLRFKYQSDLLEGIRKMVKQNKIHNAVILSAAGSLRGYQVHSVNNRTFPSKNIFTKDADAPCDLVSMNGYIIDGRVHAHMTLTNGEHAFGGHLEPGTEVFTFAIVTLGIFKDGVDLSRIDDKHYR